MADTKGGPLAGVRVVELAGIGPGPFCGMLLADLGATVIRVDRPGGPSAPGARDATGGRGGPPQVPVNYLGDFGGGSMFLALGVVAALLSARASGRGQVGDAAIVDGAAVLQAMTYGLLADGSWTDARGSNLLDTGAPYYDVYETADGRHMAVGALERQFYAEFLRLLFAPEGAPGDLPGQHDRSRWPELRSRFAARFLKRSQGEWSKTFHGTDACVAP